MNTKGFIAAANHTVMSLGAAMGSCNQLPVNAVLLEMLALLLSTSLLQHQVDFSVLSERWKNSMAPFTVPGMTIVVVQGDQTIFEGAFGYADAAQTRRVNLDTIFYIASVTKTMTGLATAVDVAEERLKWEDDVQRFLPNFKLKTGAYKLTLDDLVSHRKGLTVPGLVTQDAFSGEITDARYDWWIQNTALLSGKPKYGNEHFTLLGRILQKVHGMRWQAVVQSNVFDRLGMTRSTTSATRMYNDPNSAQPLYWDGFHFSVVPNVKTDRVMHAAGGVGSTAHDLSRYMRVLLNDGAIDGKQVLPKGLTADLFRRRTTTPSEGSIRIRDGFGVGWNLGSYRKLTPLLTHGGGYSGSIASIALLPEKRIGFALLINGQDAASGMAAVAMVDVFDRLLGLEPEDLLPSILKQAEKLTKRGAGKELNGKNPVFGGLSQPVWSYAGSYTNKQAGTLTFWVEGGQLRCRVGDYTLNLISTAKDRFTLTDFAEASELTTASFVMDGPRITGVRANFGGIDFTFQKR